MLSNSPSVTIARLLDHADALLWAAAGTLALVTVAVYWLRRRQFAPAAPARVRERQSSREEAAAGSFRDKPRAQPEIKDAAAEVIAEIEAAARRMETHAERFAVDVERAERLLAALVKACHEARQTVQLLEQSKDRASELLRRAAEQAARPPAVARSSPVVAVAEVDTRVAEANGLVRSPMPPRLVPAPPPASATASSAAHSQHASADAALLTGPQQRIARLAAGGHSPIAIAEALGLPLGEVELALNLIAFGSPPGPAEQTR